jgi:6-pyruvoyl-tetrahydropterin synthase
MEEPPHANSRFRKHYQLITDRALTFIVENIVKPFLPENHPDIKQFFGIFFWNGKKLFEIGHKEVFVIIYHDKSKKPKLLKKRISIYDDSFLIDQDELFGVGMYTYLNIFKMHIQSKKEEEKTQKFKDYQEMIQKTIEMTKNNMLVYYLNRQYALDTLLDFFLDEGVLLGQQVVLNNLTKDIEIIFDDVSTKDFLFFAPKRNWETQISVNSMKVAANIETQCSFCESEILDWQQGVSPSSIQLEGSKDVRFLIYTHSILSLGIFVDLKMKIILRNSQLLSSKAPRG